MVPTTRFLCAVAPRAAGALLAALGTLQVFAMPVAIAQTARPEAPLAPEDAWREGELVVEFRSGAARAERSVVHRRMGGQVTGRSERVDVVRLPPGLSIARALRGYGRDPHVVSVEPNLLRAPTEFFPNDPAFPNLWGLHNTAQLHGVTGGGSSEGKRDADIDAPQAWEVALANPAPQETIVAVLDSGVDVGHPDLVGSLWVNEGEIPNNGLDDDGNGYTDDVHGYDFAEDDAGVLDTRRPAGWDHGTHVAGTIAATIDNGEGIAGVCPHCKVMVLKFMDRDNHGGMVGDVASEVEAIDYAIDNGAHVINASFGAAFLWSDIERRAFERAGRNGLLSVAAAGNFNGDNDMFLQEDLDADRSFDQLSPFYPASYNVKSIVSVAASNHKDHYAYSTRCAEVSARSFPCSFTNWGRQSVDFAAPGVDIRSTIPFGGYAFLDGTSMAAPHASGVAGLVRSLQPQFGWRALKSVLMRSVDDSSGLNRLYTFPRGAQSGSFTRTNGRLNAHDALIETPATGTPASDGNINGARRIRRFRAGTLGWPGDVNDVYKKRLVEGRLYELVLNNSSGEDFDLALWKPGTQDIWQFESGCFAGETGRCKLARFSRNGDPEEIVTFRARKTGVHYLHVTAWLFESGSYELRVHRI